MRTSGSQNRATPERRRAILDGALRLFLEGGLGSTTLEVLCRSLGISRSSFYHLFKSKEAVAVELFQQAIDEVHHNIACSLAQTRTAQAGLSAIVASYLAWFQHNPDRGAFVWKVMDSELLAQHIQPVRAQQRAFVQDVMNWLEPFQQQGKVRQLPAPLLAALLIGPARDFVRSAPNPQEYQEALRILPEAAWQVLRDTHKRGD